MKIKDKKNVLNKSVDELSLAIPIPTPKHSKMYLKQPRYYDEYDPQTEAEMSDEHRRTRRLMNHFDDKASTDTIFGDHALRVFDAVDKNLYNIW